MILLFTDYGNEGPYVGQIQAKVQSIAPGVSCINIHADLPAYDVRHASFLLAAYRSQYAVGTVFLCVVDPGVGGDRLPVVLKADEQFYVGPMNGLFHDVIRNADNVDINQIDVAAFKASDTFHGRDIFAPVAAALEQGRNFPKTNNNESLISCVREIKTQKSGSFCEAIYVDPFGNIFTSISFEKLTEKSVLYIGSQAISYSRIFSDCEIGECFWYRNSIGLIEIAANQASAADILSIEIGTSIKYG